MFIFDNILLQQYLDQKVKLKVFVNGEWYFVGDRYDIHNPDEAVVYDVTGKGSVIDYRDIEQIKVGNRIITLDMLQSMQTGQPPKDDKKSEPKEEPAGDEMPEEEPPPEKKEKGPDLSWFSPHYELGRNLLKEAHRRKRR